MLEITLPLPVSVNRIWRSHRSGVHKSTEYRYWLTEAGWELRAQRPGRTRLDWLNYPQRDIVRRGT